MILYGLAADSVMKEHKIWYSWIARTKVHSSGKILEAFKMTEGNKFFLYDYSFEYGVESCNILDMWYRLMGLNALEDVVISTVVF